VFLAQNHRISTSLMPDKAARKESGGQETRSTNNVTTLRIRPPPRGADIGVPSSLPITSGNRGITEWKP